MKVYRVTDRGNAVDSADVTVTDDWFTLTDDQQQILQLPGASYVHIKSMEAQYGLAKSREDAIRAAQAVEQLKIEGIQRKIADLQEDIADANEKLSRLAKLERGA